MCVWQFVNKNILIYQLRGASKPAFAHIRFCLSPVLYSVKIKDVYATAGTKSAKSLWFTCSPYSRSKRTPFLENTCHWHHAGTCSNHVWEYSGKFLNLISNFGLLITVTPPKDKSHKHNKFLMYNLFHFLRWMSKYKIVHMHMQLSTLFIC